MGTNFKYLFLALVTIVSLTGCINDDEGDNNAKNYSRIVGTWAYEEDDHNYYYYEETTFKANGTIIVKGEKYYDGDLEDSWTERGTYELDGNELIVDIDDEITFATVSISSNKLTIIDEEGDRYVYYRISD